MGSEVGSISSEVQLTIRGRYELRNPITTELFFWQFLGFKKQREGEEMAPKEDTRRFERAIREGKWMKRKKGERIMIAITQWTAQFESSIKFYGEMILVFLFLHNSLVIPVVCFAVIG